MVSIGAGGSLTVQFATPILNDSSNPFGLDFIVFGNTGFVDTNWPAGQTDGSIFGSDTTSTRVSVSTDNVNYYTLNPSLAPVLDGLFPTDGGGSFQVPVNPTLTGADFAGLDLNGIRGLYAGSGGGTGFDIGWALDFDQNPVSLSGISYIRVDVLNGNAEIDGFSAVPEPGTWTFLGMGALALMVGARRRLA